MFDHAASWLDGPADLAFVLSLSYINECEGSSYFYLKVEMLYSDDCLVVSDFFVV